MRYYSTQRPLGPGTFPRQDGTETITNFDGPTYCEEIGREAWGYIDYKQPITPEQAAEYELTTPKVLYFEGAGWSGADISKATIGNCRIRTAFHLDDGRAVYLEIIGSERTGHCSKEVYKWQYTGFVDFCHYITDDEKNDDCNRHRLDVERRTTFEYTEAEILQFVNSLGASFDTIKVVPDLGGYRVFKDGYSPKGTERYNYGDEFPFDPEITARREAVYQKVYEIEYSELKADRENHGNKFVHSPGGIYPNFSLWVDPDDPGLLHLLRHYNGYNKHWEIRTDMGSTIEDWIATAKEEPLGRYGC